MNKEDFGFYYLHENGELIWKRFEPEVEPFGFVQKVWDMSIHAATRQQFIRFLGEARDAGANQCAIERIATQNRISLEEL